MKKKLSVLLTLFLLGGAICFAGGQTELPGIFTETISPLEVHLNFSWENIKNPANFRYGLYRSIGNELNYEYQRDITPEDHQLRAFILIPGTTYFYRINRISKKAKMPFTLKKGPSIASARTMDDDPNFDYTGTSTPDGASSTGEDKNTAAAAGDNKPRDRTGLTTVTNEGIYVGLITFAGNVNELTRRNNQGVLVPLDQSGKQVFLEQLRINYTASASYGTSLYYAEHKALANLSNQEMGNGLPSNIDEIAIITFTDGLDTSSTDASLPVIENMDFRARNDPLSYQNYISGQLKNRRIKGKNITPYVFGIRGRDVADGRDFEKTLQSIAAGTNNYYVLDSITDMDIGLSNIEANLNVYDPTVDLTISTPAYPVGTLIRITFDSADIDLRNSTNYIEATVAWRNETYCLTNITAHGEFTIKDNIDNPVRGVVYAKRSGANLQYTITINRDFYEDNVKQWSLHPNNASAGNVWQQNSEFGVTKRVTFDPIKKSILFYFVLDCSSSLSERNIDAVRTSITNFIEKLDRSSSSEVKLAKIGYEPYNYSGDNSYDSNKYNDDVYFGNSPRMYNTLDQYNNYTPPARGVNQNPGGVSYGNNPTQWESPAGITKYAPTITPPVRENVGNSTLAGTFTAPSYTAPANQTKYTGYWVQINSFLQDVLAQRMIAVLKQQGVNNASIFTNFSNGNTYYQVRLGPYASRESAERSASVMKAHPYLFTDSYVTYIN